MKIRFVKRYWENDIYYIPSRRYDQPYEKDEIIKAKLAHRKGDFKETVPVVEKWCCDYLEEYSSMGSEYDDKSGELAQGCFLRIPGYEESEYLLINYCPFCGEKIEIIKEKQNERSKE